MDEFADEEGLIVGSREPTPVMIDPPAARFPQCMVWTPLPVVSWLAPFVGHVGICREDGVILDFAGPYFVNVDNFAFGATTRYLQLSEQQCMLASQFSHENNNTGPNSGGALSWDDGIRSTMQQFQHISYNLFTCNCHSFVASCLNKLAYRGSVNWNVITVIFLILSEGQWVNKTAILKSFAPFVAIMCFGIYMVGWPFVTGWAIFNVLLIGWFVIATYVLRGFIKS